MHHDRGFTLLEIIIAISLIAFFITLPILAYSSYLKKTRDTQRKNSVNQIQSALEIYRANNGKYPPTDTWKDVLVSQGYLPNIPKDPMDGTSVAGETGVFYGFDYQSSADGQSYQLSARLEENQPGGKGYTNEKSYYTVGPEGPKIVYITPGGSGSSGGGSGSGSLTAGNLTGTFSGTGSGTVTSGTVTFTGTVTNGVFTGTYTGTVTGASGLSGTVSGSYTGPVSGNLSGTVTGTATLTGGNVTGVVFTGTFGTITLTPSSSGGLPSNTPIPTTSGLPTLTPTNTNTPTPTYTPTPSNTPTATFTPTGSPTRTPTPSNTPTRTPTPSYTLTPTNTPTPTASYSEVAAGADHTCAVTTTGGVRCWGSGPYGELGNGSTNNFSSPRNVVGLSSGVSTVSTGVESTCALTTAGAVKCWGRNTYGQLGNGTTTDSTTPVDVTGLSSGVTRISVGMYHACAVVSGIAKCWGWNAMGTLGNGTTTNSSTPVDVVGLPGGFPVISISAGQRSTCSVNQPGVVRCWGDNIWGELGNGTTTSSLTPVAVSGTSGTSAGVYITGRAGHACALASPGSVKCWGRNSSGQLGIGTTTNSTTAVNATGLTTGMTSITTGYEHTCAVDVTVGSVKCWGNDGTLSSPSFTGTVNSTTPVTISGVSSGVSRVAVGDSHNCAVMSTGAIKCWGLGTSGQLGAGSFTSSVAPVTVVP